MNPPNQHRKIGEIKPAYHPEKCGGLLYPFPVDCQYRKPCNMHLIDEMEFYGKGIIPRLRTGVSSLGAV